MTRLHLLLAYLVLALAVWGGWWVVRLRGLEAGKPGRFNEEQRALIEVGQDAEAPNAWPALTRAAELYDRAAASASRAARPADWPRRLAWPPSPNDAWAAGVSVGQLARIRGAVEALDAAGLPEALDAVAAGRRFVRPLRMDKALGAPIAEAVAAKGLGGYCRGRMVFAARDGNREQFVRSLRHALALSRALRLQASEGSELQALSNDSRTGLALMSLAGRLDGPTLRDALEELRTGAMRADPAAAVRGARLATLDAVEWSYSVDGRILPAAAEWAVEDEAPKTIGSSLGRLRLFFGPSKAETLTAVGRFYEVAEAEAGVPVRRRLAADPRPSAGFLDTLEPRQIFVHKLGPLTVQYLELAELGELHLAGARVMLAVELHRAVHGAYPARLGELEPSPAALGVRPEWLEEFRYKPSAAGGAYSLYWIGLDGRDDGGALREDGSNAPAFSPQPPGLDYVFWPIPGP